MSFLTFVLFITLGNFAKFGLAQELDYPLTISRPSLSTIGQKVEFSCILGAGNTIEDKICHFLTPDGKTLVADLASGEVTDSEPPNAVLDGYSAVGDETTCGLSIASLSQADLNQWSCLINQDSQDTPFHKGTFQILTDGFLQNVRLPRHFLPSFYEVELTPIIEVDDFTIGGRMVLTGSLDASANDASFHDKIYMHSKEISIDEDSVSLVGNTILGHEYDLEREFYVLHLENALSGNGEHSVSMTFTAILNDKLAGFYRSSYTEDGETKYLGITQFQPLDARRAFPCLDEPDLKAKFGITLGHKETMVARSNMDEISSEPHGDLLGYKLTTFADSVVMPTYLVAFMIADFDYTEGVDNEFFNIWHMKSKANQADLAADSGPKILEYMEGYFGSAYPLPKTDMVAIPDFAAGAMENWGLITYRETNILWDKAANSRADRDRVIEVIAHELAHMWFGNLVTLEWWTDLWLNEGFATYVEYKGSIAYDPDLESEDRLIIIDLQDVFEIDAYETTVAISSEVTNPAYDLVFGRISYGKGCVLIRMIEHFLTLETFNNGLVAYLEEYEFGNANRHDLWNSLNEAALADEDNKLPEDISVGYIMEPWTTQGGYPVVTVENDGGGRLTLSQKRFFLNPDAASTDDMWSIPISVTSPNGNFDTTVPDFWILDTDNKIDLLVTNSTYIFNVQQAGYYRVNYDEANWISLAEALASDSSSINRLNRAQMYDDSINLARAGQLSYDIAMDMSKNLESEKDYIATEAGLRALYYINTMFRDSDNIVTLDAYMRYLTETSYNELGFDIPNDEKYLDVLRRNSIIEAACRHMNQDCIDTARAEFQGWMDANDPINGNPIDPDLRLTIYRVAIREGGQEEFDFLLGLLTEFTTSQDIQKALYGLSESTNTDNLITLLDLTIQTDSIVRSQDAIYIYRGVGDTNVGRRVQFDWLQDKYDEVKAFYGTRFDEEVQEIIQGFMETGNTQEDIDEMQQFLDDHIADLEAAVTTIEQGIDRMGVNLNWMETNFDNVLGWLERETGTGQPTTTDGGNVSTPYTTILTVLTFASLTFLL